MSPIKKGINYCTLVENVCRLRLCRVISNEIDLERKSTI